MVIEVVVMVTKDEVVAVVVVTVAVVGIRLVCRLVCRLVLLLLVHLKSELTCLHQVITILSKPMVHHSQHMSLIGRMHMAKVTCLHQVHLSHHNQHMSLTNHMHMVKIMLGRPMGGYLILPSLNGRGKEGSSKSSEAGGRVTHEEEHNERGLDRLAENNLRLQDEIGLDHQDVTVLCHHVTIMRICDQIQMLLLMNPVKNVRTRKA